MPRTTVGRAGSMMPKTQHRLGSYLTMIFSRKQQRNTGQGAQDNDREPLANSFFHSTNISLGAGIQQWGRKKRIKSLTFKEFVS